MYELTEHRGNVNSVVTDRRLPKDIGENSLADYYIADNVSSLSYYPYGMVMPGREYSSPVYRYGFQGQERDDEVKGAGNSWNYKFRMHDPRVGRFSSNRSTFKQDLWIPKMAGSRKWQDHYTLKIWI